MDIQAVKSYNLKAGSELWGIQQKLFEHENFMNEIKVFLHISSKNTFPKNKTSTVHNG